MQVDPCIQKLRNGDVEEAWTLFVDSYRRLLFAVVKRFVDEPDDAMDLFAYICEQLRAGDLARLKRYADDPSPRGNLIKPINRPNRPENTKSARALTPKMTNGFAQPLYPFMSTSQ